MTKDKFIEKWIKWVSYSERGNLAIEMGSDLEEIEKELSKDNWIEIDDKLPKEMPIDIIINGMPYQGWVYKGQGGLFCCVENRYLSKPVDEIVEVSRISHYQPIIKPDLPIY